MNAIQDYSSFTNAALHLKVNSTDILWNKTNQSVSTTLGSFCMNPLEAFEGLKVVLMLFYIVVMVLAILGNTLIIYIVFSNKPLRTSTNIFIVNMAVCDLGIPFFLLPKKIAELFVGRYVWLIHGEAGLALCKIVPFVHDVFIDCSTLSLLLITFDRFCAVLLPHKRHWLSTKVVVILISCAWLASISINAVHFRIYNVFHKNGKTLCYAVWHSRSASDTYFKVLMITNIIVPIVLITASYSAIFHKLKKQVHILGDSISDQLRLQESLRQKKIVKMTFAIVCTFGVCWLPIILTVILQPFLNLNANSTRYPCWVYRYGEFSLHTKVLPSVTNPTLCFVFGTKYREEFNRICRSTIFGCASRRIRNQDDDDDGKGNDSVDGDSDMKVHK